MTDSQASIGTYKERTLHAALKRYLEPDTACHERRYKGFIADILHDGGVIEIQTRQFGKMRKKLDAFLPDTPVTIVYPVTRHKWLIWVDPESGETTKKRKSPKVGTPFEVFYELYAIRSYLQHPNLTISVIMVDMEEYRMLNGWNETRKRGSSRAERIPVGIGERFDLHDSSDYRKLLPDTLPDTFHSLEFSRCVSLSRSSAQTALNILTGLGVTERLSRDKQGYLYRICL